MVEIYKMNIWLISLVAISGIVFEVSEGQEVVIVMQPKVDFLVGTSANITCSYSVSDVAYVFDYIAWSHTTKDGEHDPANNVAAYLAGLPAPSYPGGGTRYTMSIDTIETSSVLMISSVAFPSDQGRYWCFAQFKKPGLTPIDDAKASLLTVVVETKTDSVTLYSAAGVPLINGTEVELSTDVPEHLFTFKVKGINPGANFTWTVGSMVLDTVSDPDHVVGPDSLTTSTSNATVRSDKDYDKLELKCVAVNYVDDPGVMISVILRVEGSAGCLQYRLDVILVCFALTAVNQVRHGIDGMVNQVL